MRRRSQEITLSKDYMAMRRREMKRSGQRKSLMEGKKSTQNILNSSKNMWWPSSLRREQKGNPRLHEQETRTNERPWRIEEKERGDGAKRLDLAEFIIRMSFVYSSSFISAAWRLPIRATTSKEHKRKETPLDPKGEEEEEESAKNRREQCEDFLPLLGSLFLFLIRFGKPWEDFRLRLLFGDFMIQIRKQGKGQKGNKGVCYGAEPFKPPLWCLWQFYLRRSVPDQIYSWWRGGLSLVDPGRWRRVREY